jgi:coproporphyrinogen III oxidase
MEQNELYEYFKDLLAQAQKETAGRIMTSSNKRGYNRSFGVSIPSVRDRINDYNARVRALNDMCFEATGKSLIVEPEIKFVKTVNDN